MKFELNPRRSLLWLVICSLCVRVAVVVLGFGSLREDFDSYSELAVTWAELGSFGFRDDGAYGGVRPTAFRPPLYPWLLSWLVRDGLVSHMLVAGLHVCLGLATVVLTYGVARRLEIRRAWLPALAVALDPILLRGSQLVMTETLAACFAILIWCIWLKIELAHKSRQRLRYVFVLGLVCGLSILARPTAAPWCLLLVAGLLIPLRSSRNADEAQHNQRPSRLGRLTAALVLASAVSLVVAPWVLRNSRQLGQPIWATTHGGYTLLLANNPPLYEHFRTYGPSRDWDAEPFHRAWATRGAGLIDPVEPQFWTQTLPAEQGPVRQLAELEDNRLAYAVAIGTIAENPGTFLVSILYRMTWLWAAWPNTEGWKAETVAIGTWYLGWYFAAIWAVVKTRCWIPSRQWWPGLTLVLCLTAVHGIYWSNMRMRGQAMAVVYLAACSVPGRPQQRSQA